jgi:hypothetical protein
MKNTKKSMVQDDSLDEEEARKQFRRGDIIIQWG